MSDPIYSINKNEPQNDEDWLKNLGAAIKDSAIDLLPDGKITLTVKTAFTVDSSILTQDVPVEINYLDENHVTLNGTPYAIDKLTDFTVSSAITKGIITLAGSLLGVASLPLSATFVMSIGVGYIYNKYIDPITDEFFDNLSGTVDVNLQLKDSFGKVLAGASYKDGLGSVTKLQAVQSFIQHSLNTNMPDVSGGMSIDIVTVGSAPTIETYRIEDGEILQRIADFAGVDLNTIKEYSRPAFASSVDNLKNRDLLYEYDGKSFLIDAGNAGLFLANPDPKHDQVYETTTDFKFTDLYIEGLIDYALNSTSNAFVLGDNSDNQLKFPGLRNSFIFGGGGKDTIDTKDNSSKLIAGGANVIYGDGGTNSSLFGDDIIKIYPGIDTVFGGKGNDQIVVSNFDGYGGLDDLELLDGDFIHGGDDGRIAYSSEISINDDGNDTVHYSSKGVKVDISDPVAGTAQRWNKDTDETFGPVDILISIENVIGSGFDDFLIGSSENNTLDGNTGNNIFDGGGGDDTLIGGADTDTYKFSGEFGKDTIIDDDGIIEIGGIKLNGTAALTTTPNKYLLEQGGKFFIMSRVDDNGVMDEAGKHLRIAVNDESDTPANSITVKDYNPISANPTTDTAFGIQLSQGVGNRNEFLIVNDPDPINSHYIHFNADVSTPAVTSLTDGSFVATWDKHVYEVDQDVNGDYFVLQDDRGIYGQKFNADGSKSGNEFLSLPDFGTAGADNLVGNNDNNTFVGGPGNDQITGGTGNDNYAFSAGDGFDTIKDSGGSDTLKLGGGLTPDDLTFSQIGRDLVIDIASGVTIVDQFSGNPDTIVEFASFDDGTVIELPSATNKVTGTESRDILTGTPANDVISSLGGSIDRMSGGDGADIFVIGAEAVNGVRERDIITDYEVGIDSILLEDGATVGSIRQSSSGVTVFLEGDLDAIYVQGDGVLVGNLTFIPEDIVI